MAVDRVARRRERADQILALDPSQGYHVPRAGRPHQAALAHRARLSGTQAGGRAWAFRGQRVARLPPPRHAVHRRLRIPGLREGDDSPPVSYTHLRAHETPEHLVCRLLLEKKNKPNYQPTSLS